MYYDPQFYEYTALCHIAKIYGQPLSVNYRLPDYSLPISRRPEFDGYFEGENIAVEVKSYPLLNTDIKEIMNKYKHVGIEKMIIVSPNFINNDQIENLKTIEFKPDFSSISKEVYKNLPFELPTFLINELSSGKHNFRFRLAKRSRDKRSRYLNQTDKKIDSVIKLRNEVIKRVPDNNPPIKILWSTKKWVSPKDHFYKNRNNLFLGGPIVFDIDGPKVHGAFKACVLNCNSFVCDMCIFFAQQETQKLIKILEWAGFRNIETFFSGRSGFHVYVFDDNKTKLNKATKKFIEKKIKIDKQVTYSLKSEIAFPLTINGFTGHQLKHVKNLNSFILKIET